MADIVAKRKAKKEAENIVSNLETEGKNAEQLKKQLLSCDATGEAGFEKRLFEKQEPYELLFLIMRRGEYSKIFLNSKPY